MNLKRPFQISAGLVGLLALLAVAVGLAALSQYRGGPAIWLRMNSLAGSGPSQACQLPGRLVPGSYQGEPAQLVSGFVLLTYTASCAAPGQPAQSVQGFAALDLNGVGCAGWGVLPPAPAAGPGAPVTIDGVSSSQCGSLAAGPGLSVVTGRVTGGLAVSVQVEYNSGVIVTRPLRQGHFGIGAPDSSGVCVVRALDAGGVILTASGAGGVGTGNCP